MTTSALLDHLHAPDERESLSAAELFDVPLTTLGAAEAASKALDVLRPDGSRCLIGVPLDHHDQQTDFVSRRKGEVATALGAEYIEITPDPSSAPKFPPSCHVANVNTQYSVAKFAEPRDPPVSVGTLRDHEAFLQHGAVLGAEDLLIKRAGGAKYQLPAELACFSEAVQLAAHAFHSLCAEAPRYNCYLSFTAAEVMPEFAQRNRTVHADGLLGSKWRDARTGGFEHRTNVYFSVASALPTEYFPHAVDVSHLDLDAHDFSKAFDLAVGSLPPATPSPAPFELAMWDGYTLHRSPRNLSGAPLARTFMRLVFTTQTFDNALATRNLALPEPHATRLYTCQYLAATGNATVETAPAPAPPKKTVEKTNVFISYRSASATRQKEELQAALEQRGFTVFNIDMSDPACTMERISEKVRASSIFVALCSDGYFASPFCRAELQAALESLPAADVVAGYSDDLSTRTRADGTWVTMEQLVAETEPGNLCDEATPVKEQGQALELKQKLFSNGRKPVLVHSTIGGATGTLFDMVARACGKTAAPRNPAPAAAPAPAPAKLPSKLAASIAAAQSQQALLEKSKSAPLQRFGEAVAKLVDTELVPLFDALAKEMMGAAKELDPDLKVKFVADVVNDAWGAMRLPLLSATTKNAALKTAIGEEAMAELRLQGRVAVASAAKVVSDVDWTPPAATEEVKETATAVGDAQRVAVASLEKKDAAAAGTQLKVVVDTVKSLMPLYKARVDALTADQKRKELYATMPSVVEGLLPKFVKVYAGVAEGLVRGENGYGDFNSLEETTFTPVNAKGKPRQPLKLLSQLLNLSVEAMPLFDELMGSVVREVDLGDKVGGVSPGGVSWHLGPLKKLNRVAEKLCLDPSQRAALDACDPAALNASGICDTAPRLCWRGDASSGQVRGMLSCSTMAHANHVLGCLVRRHGPDGTDKGRARCVRTKNRFARPSAGGWMDCLLNIAVWLEERDCWFVCEVQIVHAQLLLVRAELGAHHAYNDYRGALELLEAAGCMELGSGDALVIKGWVVRNVFLILLGPDGKPLLTEDEAADEKALNMLVEKQEWGLSRVGGGRPWRQLLVLSLDGRRVASVAPAGAHLAVVLDVLRGLQGVAQSADGRASLAVIEAAAGKAERALSLRGQQMKLDKGVGKMCISPDGTHALTTTGGDKEVHVWRITEEGPWEWVRTLNGGPESAGNFHSLHVTADGMAVAGSERPGKGLCGVCVWRLKDGALTRTLKCPSTVMCLTPDFEHVISRGKAASGEGHENAGIYRRQDGALVRMLTGQERTTQERIFTGVRNICTSPDGVYVCTADGCFKGDGAPLLWRFADGTFLRRFEGNQGGCKCMCVTLDGMHLIGDSDEDGEGSVRVWRMNDGAHVRTIKDVHAKRMCAMPDKTHLMTAGEGHRLFRRIEVRLWRISDGAPVLNIRPTSLKMEHDIEVDYRCHTPVVDACVTPNGRHVVTGGVGCPFRNPNAPSRGWVDFDKGYGHLLVTRLEPQGPAVVVEGVREAVAMPDGVHMVIREATSPPGAALRVLRISNRDCRKQERQVPSSPCPRLLSPGAVAWSCGLELWAPLEIAALSVAQPCPLLSHIGDGTHVPTLHGSSDKCSEGWHAQSSDSCVTPDGKHFIQRNVCTATVKRLPDGVQVRSFAGHPGGNMSSPVTAVCVTPDGIHAITASNDCKAMVWRIDDGTHVRTLQGHGEILQSVCTSPDGSHVVTGGWYGTVVIWRLSDGSIVRRLKAHANHARSLCFSPDGFYLVTAASDQTACVWRASDGVLLHTLEGHESALASASIAPDGVHVVTAAEDDSVVRVWRLSNGSLVHEVQVPERAKKAWVAPDGLHLVTLCADETLRVFLLKS